VNGQDFFKADLINHIAIQTFALRLSSLFTPARQPSDERPEPAKKRGVSGVASLLALHGAAIEALRHELGESAFLIDVLIDGQMRCIADQFSDLRTAVESKPHSRHGQGSIDAESAELALMLFLILHYYGFSKLPSAFKAEVGSEFTHLHEVSEVYKAAFLEGFPLVYGRATELGEEDLLMVSAIFFHRDGDGGFEMKMPREEALSLLFYRLGIRRETARGLVRQFEDQAESWLEEISEIEDG
jgi:hypothetical protein